MSQTNPYTDILKSLQEATETGSLKWEKTSLKNKYELKLDEYKITVLLIPEDTGDLSIYLPGTVFGEIAFIDESGSVFDSLKALSRTGAVYHVVESLYECARRSSNDIAKKLSAIQSKINKRK